LIGMAISSASFCSSTFHSRERALLDPPQSTVIISSRMLV
jgi:hypothetical protein